MKTLKAPPREPDAPVPQDSWLTTAIITVAFVAGFMAWMIVWPNVGG